MVIGLYTVCKGSPQSFNVIARQRCRLTVKRDEAEHAGELQYSQFLSQCQTHEHVSGKEDQVQFFATIFPASNGTVKREKVFNSTLLQQLRNFLFMAGVRVRGKPTTIKGKGLQTAGASFLL